MSGPVSGNSSVQDFLLAMMLVLAFAGLLFGGLIVVGLLQLLRFA